VVGQNQRSQIEMTGKEIAVFIDQSRTCTMATVGPGGMPHLVAMWYAWLDGRVWLESKAKAQKIVNLRRDDRMSVMVEAGNTYDTLRGVSLEGRGVIIEDPDELWRVGVNVWERYTAPYSEDVRPLVEAAATVRARRIPVIAITDSDFSPLARESDTSFLIGDAIIQPIPPLGPYMVLAQSLIIALGHRKHGI